MAICSFPPGDNTNPFESDGFCPFDKRINRSAWDASGSSGNTNDFCGKILRIHPEADGTYSISKNNLLVKNGTLKELPVIYLLWEIKILIEFQ